MMVNNVPRQIRYKKENVIIVEIIPGPKEPKLTMKTFLKPLVDELKEFGQGCLLLAISILLNLCLLDRAAFICCVLDIPTTRKLGGFVGIQLNSDTLNA